MLNCVYIATEGFASVPGGHIGLYFLHKHSLLSIMRDKLPFVYLRFASPDYRSRESKRVRYPYLEYARRFSRYHDNVFKASL